MFYWIPGNFQLNNDLVQTSSNPTPMVNARISSCSRFLVQVGHSMSRFQTRRSLTMHSMWYLLVPRVHMQTYLSKWWTWSCFHTGTCPLFCHHKHLQPSSIFLPIKHNLGEKYKDLDSLGVKRTDSHSLKSLENLSQNLLSLNFFCLNVFVYLSWYLAKGLKNSLGRPLCEAPVGDGAPHLQIWKDPLPPALCKVL